MGRKEKGSEPSSGLERRLGLARVQSLLELAADRLAAREHRLVAHAAGRELHDADVVVPVSVAAGIGRGLVEGPQAVTLPLSPHYVGHLPEGAAKGNPCRTVWSAVCDEKLFP